MKHTDDPKLENRCHNYDGVWGGKKGRVEYNFIGGHSDRSTNQSRACQQLGRRVKDP